jgi:ABC-2 type transport system permease protein
VRTLRRRLRLWRLYAWLDFMWVTRSFEKFAVYYLVGWLALCVCNLLASAAVLLSVSFFWGSLAFFAPRAAEEINTPLVRMFDHVKLFPLDGLSGTLLNGLLTVVPVGFVAWYPCRALLGHAPVWYAVWTTPLAAVLCALLAVAMFRRGMHYYESIGSSRYRDMGHRG